MPNQSSFPTPFSDNAVAVLGLGPMGRALAGALLAAGHDVTVWNRTPGRDGALLAQGARPAESAAEAVATATTTATATAASAASSAAAAGSPLVLLCVRDQSAARAVLDAAGAALRGRTVVNATSITPEDARANAADARARGFRLLEAAILTPTPTIGRPQGTVLLSGDPEAFTAHEPTLRALGTVRHVGTDPGRAAAFDAALLDLFWTTVHGLVHALALARAEGISGTELTPYAQGLPQLLPPLIEDFARRADERRHPGDHSSLASAEAGLSHVAHTARARGLDTTVLDAALAVTRRAVEAGHGSDGVSGLVELFARQATASSTGPATTGPAAAPSNRRRPAGRPR
ncbi:NAD(P)-dependent oxidoreductase [Kitasatospora aureofaciens]|uniref:6-phosphogluconate dehydrogenase n=2 Tax=Kitasatospora aureofaciens TaxID=1894 RepID=A0A8H9HQ73_KITAU|nr:NAD(P)-binding domain-containing protein [Kitasatospora aureofaciens]GGU73202.1 6-phosphogluconate dehydrogenase [Kitasatospora aureofaciens]